VFNAEYDALPGMAPVENTDPPQYKPAHACGHNLIASASIGAFIACWEALKATGGTGIVRLLGTPAEESGGGKLRLLEAGAYAGVDACMMVHPGPLTPDKSLKALSFTRTLASQRIPVAFEGLASHAGLAPWNGKNALDALVASYVSISALRQQLKPTLRVSGIITNGGKAANIIPDHTTAEFSIRAESRKELDDLREKITHCFESGAKAADCTVNVNGWVIPLPNHLAH
jgi:amidohydrolase